jgi:hypothetical protein
MPRRIAEGYGTTLAAFRSISGVTAHRRERYGCDPTEFFASRSSWDPYLALGYRLSRQRDKLAASKPASLSFP